MVDNEGVGSADTAREAERSVDLDRGGGGGGKEIRDLVEEAVAVAK